MSNPRSGAQVRPWVLREAGLPLLITAVGAWIRWWGLGDIGLTHFDEGAYALSALATNGGNVPEGLYPLQHFLSPPLFFGLSAGWMTLTGASGATAVLVVSALFSTLTIPLVYVMGRAWYGRGAGAAAATLMALSGFHAAYGRVGLTDSAFAFFFLGALFVWSLSETRRSVGLAAGAGLLIGLAWNTKYHGWLAGFIAAASVLAPRRDMRRELRSRLCRLGVCLGTAAMFYVPWFWYVCGQPGGYGRLVAEHGSFLAGAHEALRHVAIHFHAQLEFDGWLGRLGGVAALLAAASGMEGSKRRRVLLMWGPGILFLGCALGLAGFLGVAGVAWFLGGARRGHGQDSAFRLHAIFFSVFSLLTPLYHPYTRLLLPWFSAACLAAGAALQGVGGSSPNTPSLAARRAGPLALTVALVLWISYGTPVPGPWLPTARGFEDATAILAQALPRGAFVYVVGEPAVVFYLRSLGHNAWHADDPRSALERHAPGTLIHLVEGHYARLTQEGAQLRSRHVRAFSEIARVPVGVGTIRLLDDNSPSSLRAHRAELSARYDLRLFAVVVPRR